VFGLGVVRSFADDEDIDHFILPETPPTIERVKNPPLDQPFLKKQNFVDEFDISPAPVLVGLKFPSLTTFVNPIEAGLYCGGFASRGGSLVYSSTNSVTVSYLKSSTEGEYQNLSQDKNIFNFGYGMGLGPDKNYYLNLKNSDNDLFDERKTYYGFDTGYGWYARSNLNIKLAAAYSKGEIKGLGLDESVSADLKVQWVTFEGQKLTLSAAPSKDTSLDEGRVFNDASLMYDIMLFSRIVVSGGGRLTGDKTFAQGNISARLAPGLKMSVNYEPEIKKTEWSSLYINDSHVQINNNILFPESVYSFTEKLSYYSGEKNLVELEVSQAQWKNYILWQSLPGSALINPVNYGEVYVSGAKLKAMLATGRISYSVTAEKNLDCNLTFVPEYKAAAGIEVATSLAVFGAGYSYTGPMYYQAGSLNQLGSYENASVSIKKAVSGNIELHAWCDNVFSRKLETQPGFVRNAPVFYAGIDLKL
jgi:hypothetical protein